MDENDTGVSFLCVGEPPRSLDEVIDVESHQDPTLPGRLAKKCGIFECLQGSIAGGDDHIMP